MSRIQNTFATLKSQHKKALIPYITAGDPNPQLTVALMHGLVEAGKTDTGLFPGGNKRRSALLALSRWILRA